MTLSGKTRVVRALLLALLTSGATVSVAAPSDSRSTPSTEKSRAASQPDALDNSADPNKAGPDAEGSPDSADGTGDAQSGTSSAEQDAAASASAMAGADREKAETFKTRGDALFRARHYLEAVDAYDKSYAAYQNPRVLYNKGRALEALGRYAAALGTLQRFKAEAPLSLVDSLQGFDALLQEMAKKVGLLNVQVNVRGAEIIWSHAVLGASPLAAPVMVNAGSGQLRVVKEGFFSFERDVVLGGGETATFDVNLESKARNGKLSIESHVPGSSIMVDNRRLGQAPTEVVLPPGTYRVVAHREGYEDALSQVVLETGQDRKITLDPLDTSPAVYQRWWFWTGVGVVAVGAVTAVIVLSQEKDGSSGDFSPDTITAGALRF